MKEYRCLGTTLLALFAVVTIGGCADSLTRELLVSAVYGPDRSIPPDRPQPVTSFSVEFVPTGAERHPPTNVKDVKRFKNVLHLSGKPDSIRMDESPTRPYVRIGELKFGKAWYYSSNIRELVDMHVSRVGGDAVLVQHLYQTAAATMKNPESGKHEDVYYMSIVLEVIRYTDR